jgi:hypothetical protein
VLARCNLLVRPARRVVAGALAAAAVTLGAACGGGESHEAACALFARLDQPAGAVEGADLADPGGFEEALDAAVLQYTATIDDLRAELPVDLHDELDRIEAAVAQYRFTDAIDDRVTLEGFEQEHCAASTPPT